MNEALLLAPVAGGPPTLNVVHHCDALALPLAPPGAPAPAPAAQLALFETSEV